MYTLFYKMCFTVKMTYIIISLINWFIEWLTTDISAVNEVTEYLHDCQTAAEGFVVWEGKDTIHLSWLGISTFVTVELHT